MANESLEMKVDLSDFLMANEKLSAKEGRLNDILGRYASLKRRASEFIEDDDSRCEKMQQAVDAEIKKVLAQLKLVENIHNQIQKVVDAMNSMEEQSEKIIEENKQTIKDGISSIIDLEALGLGG